MELFAISGLLNGLAAIGLASFIYFRSPKDPRHWTFGLLGISTAIWSFGYFAWQISDSEAYALFNLRLLMAGAIFIPITFLHHVLYLLHKEIAWKNVIKCNYVVGGIFDSALDFTAVTILIPRLIIITSALCSYTGFVMPKFLKKLFLKQN